VGTVTTGRSHEQHWYITPGHESPGPYFRVMNREYPGHFLAKWKVDDESFGTYLHGKDLWKFTPLYSDGQIEYERLFKIDNTDGTTDINHTHEYQIGITSSTQTTFGVEIMASLETEIAMMGNLTASLTASFSHQ
jgi:hypothetical protein